MATRLLLTLICITTATPAKYPDNFDPPFEVIAFGSCNRHQFEVGF